MRRLKPATDFGLAFEPVKKRGVPQRRKTCPVCSKPFRPKSGRQVTCDSACAAKRKREVDAAYRLRHIHRGPTGAARTYTPRQCTACGAQFSPRTGNQKVCRGQGCPPGA